jgi:hypothetical protein
MIPMVKRFRAKKDLPDVGGTRKSGFLWRKDNILTQIQPDSPYYRPDHVTPPDPENESEWCLGYPLHDDVDRWDEYYEEIPMIPFKEAPTFHFYKVRCEAELKALEEQIQPMLDRMKKIKEWYHENV